MGKGAGLIVNLRVNEKNGRQRGGGVTWVWRKADVLAAALFVAGAAIAGSQCHAFLEQYQERLARDHGQAKARIEEIKTGLRYKLMNDAVRTELETAAQTRFDQLNAAHIAIASAGALARPFAFVRHREPGLLAETERGFVPRMPQRAGAIFYTALGALVGFTVYELVKFPVMLLARPRQRKFRRRG